MTQHDIDERKLTELVPARRNRYYYGKLMDVLHFSMEQQYVLSKQWLFNRAIVGPGVVCGLDVQAVTTSAGRGILIPAGLALDGWGREVIVPQDVQIVPLALTDQCGNPAPAGPLPAHLMVQLCYQECLVDLGPALVGDPDCGGTRACEAGTVVESCCLKVVAGSAPAVTLPCAPQVLSGLKQGNLQPLLLQLAQTCPADPDDPCLTLANLTVAADGTITVDTTPCPVAPTNRLLAQLISCLADCCASGGLLQMTAANVYSTGGRDPATPGLTPAGTLGPPFREIRAAQSNPDLPIDLIEFVLSIPYDVSSVSLSRRSAASASVWVNLPPGSGKGPQDQVVTTADPKVLRLYRRGGFVLNPPMSFSVVLKAGPDGAPPGSQAVIKSTTGGRLDGENNPNNLTGPPWHSGNGIEGGDFTLSIEVTA